VHGSVGGGCLWTIAYRDESCPGVFVLRFSCAATVYLGHFSQDL
jgi:hypothetical protein